MHARLRTCVPCPHVTGQEAEDHRTAVSVRATVKSEGQGRVHLKVMQQVQWRPLIVLVGWAQ